MPSHTLISRLLHRLNEPFPSEHSFKGELLSAFYVALFVTCFLFLIRPGAQDVPALQWFFVCIGFGLVTFITVIAFDAFCHLVLKLETDSSDWTLGKWILLNIALISLIAIGNQLYFSYLIDWRSWNIDHFLVMMMYTWIVGIFPIVFSGFLIQLNGLRKHIELANGLSSNLATDNNLGDQSTRASDANTQTVVLKLGGDSTRIVSLTSLRYAQAMQNYVSLCLYDGRNSETIILRDTMANVAGLFTSSLTRCHRSFLVNLNAVSQVSGNAQGLKLILGDIPKFEVPVSRSYIDTVRNGLSWNQS